MEIEPPEIVNITELITFEQLLEKCRNCTNNKSGFCIIMQESISDYFYVQKYALDELVDDCFDFIKR